MLETNKINLLDNYQLYLLIHNDSIDPTSQKKLKTEYKSRNLSNKEKERLQNKYQLNHSSLNSEIKKNNWNPIFTAFAINHHFRHLALLKTLGKKKEAKKYMIDLYIGLILYFVFIFLMVFIIKSK